jgi:hypothetical protein
MIGVAASLDRVMNAPMARQFKKIVPDAWRVVADGDLVTGVPSWGYKHVGTEVG